MVYLVTSRPEEYTTMLSGNKEIELANTVDFSFWYKTQTATNLDTETNVTEGLYSYKMTGPKSKRVFVLDDNGERIPEKRDLYVVQIGSIDGETQYIFDQPLSCPKMKKVLRTYFMSTKPKYLHNTLFDSSVILFNLGVNPKAVKDTMLLSHILHTGLDMPKGWHSYAGCLERYLKVEISKEEQTSFTTEPMRASQIEYAAIDVIFPYKLYQEMYKKIEEYGLQNVVILEEAVVRAYAASMCDNFYLNIEAWKKNMAVQQQNLEEAESEFRRLVLEYFKEDCIKLGFIREHPVYDFNWRSSTKVRAIFKELYPDMEANTKPERAKYLKTLEPTDSNYRYLELLQSGDTDTLENLLIATKHDILIKTGIYLPPDTLELNLNSNEQMLALFQLIKPDLTAVNKKALGKIRHPLKIALDKYNRAAKLVSSYGENFINQVNPDGMLRPPSYSQILATGRSSMSLYQLLPGNNAYRNCFYYKPGFKVVTCDFSSQEAVIAATVCQDPQMLKIFENNWDFHSYCASLLFPDEWKALGGDPQPKDKPSDPLLVKRRNATKATSFGLFYGKSAIGLAETLDIPATTEELLLKYEKDANEYVDNNRDLYKQFCNEQFTGKENKLSFKAFIKQENQAKRFLPEVITASDLIDLFYKVFPTVKEVLGSGAKLAVENCYIRTKDTFQRIRFFDAPNDTKEAKAIEREASNLPIQGKNPQPCLNWVNC